MSDRRTFEVSACPENDAKAVNLLHIISTVIMLQRRNGLQPLVVRANTQVFVCIKLYLGKQVDNLYGVKLHVDTDEHAMPFVVEGKQA